MKLLDIQNRIQALMSLFVTQVKAAGAMSRTDLNRVAETVLVPLLREAYGYRQLRNLNDDEQNYPGVDLGDETAHVAFQVTATATGDKVKETLQTFMKYGLYQKYDRLIIYILKEKQASYSGSGYEAITRNLFSFDKEQDIWDYTDLLRKVASLQLDGAQRVLQVLEANFGESGAPLFHQIQEPKTEAVYLNLLELFIPETLYVADLAIDRDEVIHNSQQFKIKLGRTSSTRDLVRAVLEQRDLRFAVDWECHAGQLITFHNLEDASLPLREVIDPGTVTPLEPEEFYAVDENQERVFKSLLRRCLQQKLYHQRIAWQNEEHLFLFMEEEGNPVRKETWRSSRAAQRTVYERKMKRDKPDEILDCKHLAFETQYFRLGNQWYLLIKPEWFFSYNGYRRSYYGEDKIDFLKRKERNAHVFNHLKFIAHILKYDKPPTLFEESYRYPFLSFGSLASFDSAPMLDDDEWLPGEDKQERRNLQDAEGTLPLPFEL